MSFRTNSRGNTLGNSGSLVLSSSSSAQNQSRHPVVKSPDQLRTKTQKSAMEVMQREERNAKKSRLEALLVQQFCGKYGTKQANSSINNAIRSTITEFLEGFVNVNDAEKQVARLENEVRQVAESIKEDVRQRRLQSQMDSRGQEENSRPSTNQHGFYSQNQLNEEKVKLLKSVEWPLVNAVVSTVTEEEKKRKETAELNMKKLNFKSKLDEQINYKAKLKEDHLKEKNSALAVIQTDLAVYEDEIARKKREKEEKFRSEREMRLRQIEENKSIRDQERQMKIAQEQYEMARARRLAEEEEEQKRALREKQKRNQDLLFIENEHNKKLKEQALREKQAYEKKLNEDYERKLELEEIARQSAFKNRMDQLQQFASSYEAKVGNQIKAQMASDNEQILKSLADKEREDELKERLKVEKRREASRRDADFNKTMMEQKKLEKEREKMESLEIRLRIEKEAKDAKRREAAIEEEKKQKLLEAKKDLDRQMLVRLENKRRDKATFSEDADRENQAILKKLEEDPTLLAKVVEKVTFYRAPGADAEKTGKKPYTSQNSIF